MKNILKVDSVNKLLVMDRTFAKASVIVGSEEYIMLQNARRDYPTYKVKRKEIKRNAKKECYRGLTYKFMESYIKSHSDAAAHQSEYDELRLISECHSIRYPTIKAWFLTTYPEVAQFGMTSKEIQEVPLAEAA